MVVTDITGTEHGVVKEAFCQFIAFVSKLLMVATGKFVVDCRDVRCHSLIVRSLRNLRILGYLLN